MSGLLSRGVIVVAVLIACAVGLVAAFALMIAAEYFAFAMILSPPLAALAAAGTALLFCVIAVVVGKLILSGMKKRARKNLHTRVAVIMGEIFGADLGGIAERNPGRALAVALIGGFAIGFSPKIRRAVLMLLRR